MSRSKSKLKEILVGTILVLSPMQTCAVTAFPSDRPSSWPTSIPTVLVTTVVSNDPSTVPTDRPSGTPSHRSSMVPSSEPSTMPTLRPSWLPTSLPTLEPSLFPSNKPSMSPSNVPTYSPSSEPSTIPTLQPSWFPTSLPTLEPSLFPSNKPSMSPSNVPTYSPSSEPSKVPSNQPSLAPTTLPSLVPTDEPSLVPSNSPSSIPSYNPSLRPTFIPSIQPTLSSKPSSSPSTIPSISIHPTSFPTSIPSTSFVPSMEPSLRPTMQPSSLPTVTASGKPSKVPSVLPSMSPTMYNCTENYDIAGSFYVNELDISKNCAWVKRKDTETRCQYLSVRNHCPVTCGLCPGPPSGAPSPKPSNSPSAYPTLSFSPVASPSLKPTTSGMPSTQPSPAPPVPVVTLVDIELGPIQGEVMTNSEKTLFEEIATSWIRPLLINEEPSIQLLGLKVIEQKIVAQSRRRSLQEGSRLMVKIQIEGNYIPTNDMPELNISDYEKTIKNYFSTKETSDTLMKELQTSDDDYSKFFRSATYLALYSSEKEENPITTGPGGEKEKNMMSDNDIIIIASAVSGGAIILFGAAMYVYTRKKRDRNNATLESLEHDVELDMDNIFPDIELSNTKNGGGSKEEDWEALQPQRPEPNRPTRERMMGEQPQTQSQPQTQPQPLKKQQQAQQKLQHLQPQPKLQSAVMESRQKTGYMVTEDDATDGGRSLNTFNTLENIYSGEADNASYQSYGYSLDDGIGSKLSISPGTTQMNSAATESGPMKMDLYALNSSRYNFIDDDDTLELSVGTPGSIYSGLTTDDASLQVDKKSALDSADRKMPAAEGDDMSSSFIRECQAPPGKLGIIIDTTKDGPVVYQVKSGSPLENIIFAGDRIIAIDDIDTRGMTASNVTKIVARKCDEPRKITVSSKTFKGTF